MQRILTQENAKGKKSKNREESKTSPPNNKIARIWNSTEIEKDNNMSIESSTKTECQNQFSEAGNMDLDFNKIFNIFVKNRTDEKLPKRKKLKIDKTQKQENFQDQQIHRDN